MSDSDDDLLSDPLEHLCSQGSQQEDDGEVEVVAHTAADQFAASAFVGQSPPVSVAGPSARLETPGDSSQKRKGASGSARRISGQEAADGDADADHDGADDENDEDPIFYPSAVSPLSRLVWVKHMKVWLPAWRLTDADIILEPLPDIDIKKETLVRCFPFKEGFDQTYIRVKLKRLLPYNLGEKGAYQWSQAIVNVNGKPDRVQLPKDPDGQIKELPRGRRKSNTEGGKALDIKAQEYHRSVKYAQESLKLSVVEHEREEAEKREREERNARHAAEQEAAEAEERERQERLAQQIAEQAPAEAEGGNEEHAEGGEETEGPPPELQLQQNTLKRPKREGRKKPLIELRAGDTIRIHGKMAGMQGECTITEIERGKPRKVFVGQYIPVDDTTLISKVKSKITSRNPSGDVHRTHKRQFRLMDADVKLIVGKIGEDDEQVELGHQALGAKLGGLINEGRMVSNVFRKVGRDRNAAITEEEEQVMQRVLKDADEIMDEEQEPDEEDESEDDIAQLQQQQLQQELQHARAAGLDLDTDEEGADGDHSGKSEEIARILEAPVMRRASRPGKAANVNSSSSSSSVTPARATGSKGRRSLQAQTTEGATAAIPVVVETSRATAILAMAAGATVTDVPVLSDAARSSTEVCAPSAAQRTGKRSVRSDGGGSSKRRQQLRRNGAAGGADAAASGGKRKRARCIAALVEVEDEQREEQGIVGDEEEEAPSEGLDTTADASTAPTFPVEAAADDQTRRKKASSQRKYEMVVGGTEGDKEHVEEPVESAQCDDDMEDSVDALQQVDGVVKRDGADVTMSAVVERKEGEGSSAEGADSAEAVGPTDGSTAGKVEEEAVDEQASTGATEDWSTESAEGGCTLKEASGIDAAVVSTDGTAATGNEKDSSSVGKSGDTSAGRKSADDGAASAEDSTEAVVTRAEVQEVVEKHEGTYPPTERTACSIDGTNGAKKERKRRKNKRPGMDEVAAESGGEQPEIASSVHWKQGQQTCLHVRHALAATTARVDISPKKRSGGLKGTERMHADHGFEQTINEGDLRTVQFSPVGEPADAQMSSFTFKNSTSTSPTVTGIDGGNGKAKKKLGKRKSSAAKQSAHESSAEVVAAQSVEEVDTPNDVEVESMINDDAVVDAEGSAGEILAIDGSKLGTSEKARRRKKRRKMMVEAAGERGEGDTQGWEPEEAQDENDSWKVQAGDATRDEPHGSSDGAAPTSSDDAEGTKSAPACTAATSPTRGKRKRRLGRKDGAAEELAALEEEPAHPGEAARSPANVEVDRVEGPKRGKKCHRRSKADRHVEDAAVGGGTDSEAPMEPAPSEVHEAHDVAVPVDDGIDARNGDAGGTRVTDLETETSERSESKSSKTRRRANKWQRAAADQAQVPPQGGEEEPAEAHGEVHGDGQQQVNAEASQATTEDRGSGGANIKADSERSAMMAEDNPTTTSKGRRRKGSMRHKPQSSDDEPPSVADEQEVGQGTSGSGLRREDPDLAEHLAAAMDGQTEATPPTTNIVDTTRASTTHNGVSSKKKDKKRARRAARVVEEEAAVLPHLPPALGLGCHSPVPDSETEASEPWGQGLLLAVGNRLQVEKDEEAPGKLHQAVQAPADTLGGDGIGPTRTEPTESVHAPLALKPEGDHGSDSADFAARAVQQPARTEAQAAEGFSPRKGKRRHSEVSTHKTKPLKAGDTEELETETEGTKKNWRRHGEVISLASTPVKVVAEDSHSGSGGAKEETA